MTEIGSKRQARFDVVVVGAGPAGIASACIAAEEGLTVAVVETTGRPGGQIWRLEQAASMPRQGRRWLSRFQASGARLLLGSTAVAAPAADVLLTESRQGPLEIRWKKLILATGARELLLPFPGWTLANVVGAGGLQVLVKAGWPVAGKRVVVAGSGPLLFSVAAGVRKAGAKVVVLAEQTSWLHLFGFGAFLPVLAPSKLIQAAEYQTRLLGVRYRPGCWPVSAQGRDQVESVTLSTGSKTWTIPCDVLACGFNLVANLELPRLLGCRIVDGRVTVDPWQETSVPNVYCAGEPTGLGGVDRALIEGQIAGFAVTGQQDRARRLFRSRGRAWMFSRTLDRGFALRQEVLHLARPDTIVCRCEDVTLGQLQGYDRWRDARLHTRCGMGTCQGRICGGAVQALFGWQTAAVRPPVFPTSIGALASAGEAVEHESENRRNGETVNGRNGEDADRMASRAKPGGSPHS